MCLLHFLAHVQFSELLAIRHCVFLMGPTGSGRSECYKVRCPGRSELFCKPCYAKSPISHS